MGKKTIIVIIPLILSIGIIPSLPFTEAAETLRGVNLSESDFSCRSGQTLVFHFNRNNYICTLTTTADRWVQLGIAEIVTVPEDQPEQKLRPQLSPPPPFAVPISNEIGLETIETRSGTITIDHDYLTPESAKLLSDELFFQRAVQVYQLAYPAVGGAGIFYGIDKVGASTGDILYWSDYMTSDAELLTANVSVLYLISPQDLSNGPIVIDIPAGRILGHIDNIYQQPLTDIGIPGPNKGEGGKFLILPPNYDGEVPENYFTVQSDTMQFFFIARSFVDDGDKESSEERLLQINSYHLSDAENPPKAKFIDLNGKSVKMAHPTTEGFWEFLHQVYSKETVVRDEDKNLIGLMHTIGIFPGEPFEPDEHSKKLLDKAAIVANLMTRNIGYDSPVKESWIYYPGKQWELGLMTKNPQFEDERGVTQIEPRLSFTYQAITVADAMVLELREKGSKYLLNYRDADGNFLTGSNSYKLNIPANVPAVNFWSVVVYDAETRSLIVNDQRPRPGFGSQYTDQYTQNKDGSYDVYFGQEAPEGYENHLIKTNEGDGFFVIFRFYGPTEAYYDKSWQLPDIELIE